MKAVLVLLCAALSLAAAQVSIQQVEPHPDHPNACYLEEEKKAYPVESTWTVEGCIKGSCRRSGTDYIVTYTGCGKLADPTPPCKIVENKSAQHPDCCPKYECP